MLCSSKERSCQKLSHIAVLVALVQQKYDFTQAVFLCVVAYHGVCHAETTFTVPIKNLTFCFGDALTTSPGDDDTSAIISFITTPSQATIFATSFATKSCLLNLPLPLGASPKTRFTKFQKSLHLSSLQPSSVGISWMMRRIARVPPLSQLVPMRSC